MGVHFCTLQAMYRFYDSADGTKLIFGQPVFAKLGTKQTKPIVSVYMLRILGSIHQVHTLFLVTTKAKFGVGLQQDYTLFPSPIILLEDLHACR